MIRQPQTGATDPVPNRRFVESPVCSGEILFLTCSDGFYHFISGVGKAITNLGPTCVDI